MSQNLQDLFDKQSNLHPRKYKTLSEEGRAKVSAANAGKVVSDETRAKISAANAGKVISEETRAKMRESHIGKTGKPNSPETRAKISESLKGREVWNKGIPATEERKANISKAKTGKPNPKKCKPIMTPNGLFPSAQAVADAAGVTYVTVWNWIKRWPEHYYYIEAK